MVNLMVDELGLYFVHVFLCCSRQWWWCYFKLKTTIVYTWSAGTWVQHGDTATQPIFPDIELTWISLSKWRISRQRFSSLLTHNMFFIPLSFVFPVCCALYVCAEWVCSPHVFVLGDDRGPTWRHDGPSHLLLHSQRCWDCLLPPQVSCFYQQDPNPQIFCFYQYQQYLSP